MNENYIIDRERLVTLADNTRNISGINTTLSIDEINEALSTASVGGSAVQPDWNQNDESAKDFIKNRTHYDTRVSREVTIMEKNVVPDTSEQQFPLEYKVVDNAEVFVYIDGVLQYTGAFVGSSLSFSPSPMFFISINNDSQTITFYNEEFTGLCKILTIVYDGELKRLDEKYLPEGISASEINQVKSKMDATHPKGTGSLSMNRKINSSIGQYSCAVGYEVTASGVYSHAEGYKTTAEEDSCHAEGYSTTASGDSSHAEGVRTAASGNYSHAEGFETTASEQCSHSEGYKTTASGQDSHAEGRETTAGGNNSHAEGRSTIASAADSHAEGFETTASGLSAHAEGSNTTAKGQDSHAEGLSTAARGYYSHAEGFETIASGISAHAEGYGTIASENHSHAEGSYTIASGPSQHVHGAYNIEDVVIVDTETHRTKYVHIVGNGESEDARSNAHTLDWDGNAWYAGDVYVGSITGTNIDSGAKKLATEDFVTEKINLITGGTNITSEIWTFTLEDGTTVTKRVVLA